MDHAEIEARILKIGNLAGACQFSEEPEVRELAMLAIRLCSDASFLCGWRDGALQYLAPRERSVGNA